jgi:hypothetical protein
LLTILKQTQDSYASFKTKKLMKKKINKKQNLIISSGIGLLFSFPVTGFVYGFLVCKDCGEGISGILGRIFIGLVELILTTITLGKPYDNEGGTSITNLRLYIILTFVVITLFMYQILNRIQKNKIK